MKFPSIVLLITAFIFAGCSSVNSKQQSSRNDNPTHNTTDADGEIVNKYWKLITLEGQPVTMAENQEREVFFTMKTADNKVTGFAGCNNFFGTYTLDKGWRVRFSQMGSTMMACPDLKWSESEFLKVFELTDNYTLRNDTLSLNVGRRAPLAVFAAVYMK